MARSTLTAQVVARTGLTVTLAAADALGSQWQNNGRQLLRVKNTDAATKTITVPIPVTVDGQAVASRTVVVAATTGDVLIGPFPTQFNQPDGSGAWVDYSAVTNVTVALIEVPYVT